MEVSPLFLISVLSFGLIVRSGGKFTVGTKRYAFTIGATADVSDFGGNAQAIIANHLVKVTVQFAGSIGTVLKVERSNS